MLGLMSDHFVVRPPSARMITRAANPSAWASSASSKLTPGLSQQHADAEEEQQGRQPEPGAEPGGQDRDDHDDGADEQDEVEVDHRRSPSPAETPS